MRPSQSGPQAKIIAHPCMCMYSERLLVRFLLDILESSLVDLDNSAWEID